MSFMMYTAAIVCAPLYFLLRKRWGAFVLSGIFYLLALGFVISMVFAPVGFIFWFFGVMHAMWDMRSVMHEKAMQRQAALIAEKMAAKSQG